MKLKKFEIQPVSLDLFTPELEAQTSLSLEKLGLSLKNSHKLAESILRLSDFYIQNPNKETPWNERWAQIAYLAYFHPLNLSRNRLAIHRGNSVGFFNGLKDAIDFGAGLGSASSALKSETSISHFSLIEQAQACLKLFEKDSENNWDYFVQFEKSLLSHPERAISVFSYALTELESLPSWAFESEALMILEPATSQDGRRLLHLRQDLLARGFYIWAPCTHQGACPLLNESKTDWCHDRAHLKSPEWFLNIERHLPFRNTTITTSYLLARKRPPQERPSQVRLVGDHLEEKGKSRQMICRGPKREFLSWLHRQGAPPCYPRGELIKMPTVTVCGQELRVEARP